MMGQVAYLNTRRQIEYLIERDLIIQQQFQHVGVSLQRLASAFGQLTLTCDAFRELVRRGDIPRDSVELIAAIDVIEVEMAACMAIGEALQALHVLSVPDAPVAAG